MSDAAKRSNRGPILALVFMGLVGAALFIGYSKSPTPPRPSPAVSAGAAAPSMPQVQPWDYSSQTDEVTSKVFKFAELSSDDRFNGPYDHAAVTTTLRLQRAGKEQIVAVINPKLQFTCSHFTDTYVLVKFDAGAAQKYKCNEEPNHPYGYLIILNPTRFISKLKAAKRILIQADVYNRGSETMHFSNPGLEWNSKN